MPFDKAW